MDDADLLGGYLATCFGKFGFDVARLALDRPAFDQPEPRRDLDIPRRDIGPDPRSREPLERLDPVVRAALEEAIRRVRTASAAQVPPPIRTELGPGAVVEQRWQPVRRAGVYVPGGKAVYPSSVVMNVVPAQVAGVGEVALASPPQAEFGGRVHPDILAAAKLLGQTSTLIVGYGGAGGPNGAAWVYGYAGAGGSGAAYIYIS